MNRIARLFCAVTLLAVCPLVASAAVLQIGNPQQQKEKPETKVRVIALKHAELSVVMKYLEHFLTAKDKRPRWFSDPRTNSIIVNGTEEEVEHLEKLVKTFDVPTPSKSDSPASFELQIYSVEQFDSNIYNIVRTAVARKCIISYDRPNKKIMVYGSPDSHALLKNFLRSYEKATAENKTKETATNIRLYWLVSSDKDGGELPDELSDVVRELEKLKIGNLRVATLMNIVATDQFKISGSSQIDEEITLEFEGYLDTDSSQERRTAEIKIRAQRVVEKTEKNVGGAISTSRTESLGHLSTTVNAPLGHFIVLGTTSIQKRSSVFVLQFLPAK